MKAPARIKHITKWIKDYATKNKIKTLVVGISGGIDSAVVSTLCAETGLPTVVLSMPIKQRKDLHNLSLKQGQFLTKKYKNVNHLTIDLTPTFRAFEKAFGDKNTSLLAFANSRARLRMATLYQVAQSQSGIVVGTGNKVEDFGVGFYTKYGDGGVDISPIGDCLKTEVWEMGALLGVPQEIIDAPPTDGLWDDGRTDQDQLGGISYADLEKAMSYDELGVKPTTNKDKETLKKYRAIRAKTVHKMMPIPVCKVTK